MNQRGKKKNNKEKRNKDNLRDLWDNVKCPSIRITGIPEEGNKQTKKDHEKTLEEIIVENFPKMGKEIIVENFPKMGKEIITQVQETQTVPNRINPR